MRIRVVPLVLTLACALAGGSVPTRAQSVVLQPGTIQGQVTLGDLAISRMRVNAAWTTQSAYADFHNTDDYSLIVNVPTGTTPVYTVYPTIYTDGGIDVLNPHGLAQTVAVNANAVSQLDLAYEPAFIEGTVSTPGATLAYASVGAWGSGWSASTRTLTGSQTFRFAIMPGTSVTASATVYFSDGTAVDLTTALSDVLAGETRVWNLTAVAPSNSISGVLTVDPLRTPVRQSMVATGPNYRSVLVQGDGTYAISGLIDGSYGVFPDLAFSANGEKYLRGPHGPGSGFAAVTLAGGPVMQDRHVPLATISGTLALSGSRTLASAYSARLEMSGAPGSVANYAYAGTAASLSSGDFELVVTPGRWLLNRYHTFRFLEATPYLNSTLQLYDFARAGVPVEVAQGANTTMNLHYATGSVTIMFRTTSGTFGIPRLQGSCQDVSGTGLATVSQINSVGNQQNVTEAPVTFIGVKGRCTLRAYARPTGSLGETSFGEVIVEVVPGSDQTVDLGGPTLSVLTPGANTAFTATTADVTGKVTDDQEVASVTVNGISATLTSTGNTADPREMSFASTISLVPGANVIETVATDTAGKVTRDTRTVYLDAEAPALSLNIADGSLPPGTTTISGTATDNVGISTISVNGAVVYTTSGTPQTSVTFSKSVTLDDGGTLEVVIQDLGGLTTTEIREVRSVPADATAPVISVPSSLTVEATSASGAVVAYSATAHDETDGAVPPSCSPATGATFALGTHTVTCTATDAAGNTATSSFSVSVRDTTAPVLTMPSAITLVATSATGAPATFAATATDIVSGTVPVVCSQTSGSEFAGGTTTVTCTATDQAGNSASGAFTVTVAYGVCALYDTGKLHKSGSTVPLRLQICTASGENLSSPALVVHARQLVLVSSAATGEVEDAGYANPDDNFRYDPTVGGTGGYVFNLQTKGLGQGGYDLIFTVNGAPAASPASFKIR